MRAILVCCGLVGCAALAQAQYVMLGGTPVGRAMIEPVGMLFPKSGKPAPRVCKTHSPMIPRGTDIARSER